jgi:hypothetical protein
MTITYEFKSNGVAGPSAQSGQRGHAGFFIPWRRFGGPGGNAGPAHNGQDAGSAVIWLSSGVDHGEGKVNIRGV